MHSYSRRSEGMEIISNARVGMSILTQIRFAKHFEPIRAPGVQTVAVTQTGGVVLAGGGGTRYGLPEVLGGGGQWLRAAVSAVADGGWDGVLVLLGAAGV